MIIYVIVAVLLIAIVSIADFSVFFLDKNTEKLLYFDDSQEYTSQVQPEVEKEQVDASTVVEEEPENAPDLTGEPMTEDEFDFVGVDDISIDDDTVRREVEQLVNEMGGL